MKIKFLQLITVATFFLTAIELTAASETCQPKVEDNMREKINTL